jgi:hypothetical protein
VDISTFRHKLKHTNKQALTLGLLEVGIIQQLDTFLVNDEETNQDK